MLNQGNKKLCSDHHLVGDPVDVVTGTNIDQSFEFRLIGPLELRWHRNYDSSKSTVRYALGWGQTHDYDRRLRYDGDGIKYEYPVGKEISFPPLLEDGEEAANQGFVLIRISATVYQVHHRGELPMEFEFASGAETACLKRIFRARDQIRFFYTRGLHLKGIIDSEGRKIEVRSTPEGLIRGLQILDEENQPKELLVAYTYDDAGNLISTQNNDGDGHTFAWDSQNLLTRRTGRTGFSFRFEYDAEGRCTKAWGDKRTHGVALTYEIPGSVTKVIRADLGEWTYFFDANGLTQIMDPLGGNRGFVHNKNGQLISELDTNGNETRYKYDKTGALIAKIDPLGNRVSQPEDPNAPNPRTHRVAANPAEYQWGLLLDLNSVTLPTIEERDRLPLSRKNKKLVCTRTNSESVKSHKPYRIPPLGVLWWPKPTLGRVFSDLGKLVAQLDESGNQREWAYDASGNLAQYSDFDGKKWIYQHQHWHFLTSLTDPLGNEIKINYTPEGEVAEFIDAGGTQSEYKYDYKDKLVEVKRHGVVRETYTLDAEGNLIAKHAVDGRELLQIEIGAGNLPVKRSLASGEKHRFEYDEAGRYLVAATNSDVLEFAYDVIGNPLSEIRNGKGVVYRFGGASRFEELVLFDNFVVEYCNEEAGTTVITDPTGGSHSMKRTENGILEVEFSNGTREISQFDNCGRCLFKNKQSRDEQSNWIRKYHWSGEGELLSVKDNQHGDVTHSYDDAHRLESRSVKGKTEHYEMDEAGNLLSQPGLSNVSLRSGNRIKTANGFEYTYNDRNHIASRETDDGTVRYHYDSRDQLVRIEMHDGLWEADYDALGRRTRKKWKGVTKEFYWSNDQLIAEIDGDGKVRQYIYPDQLALTPFMFIDYQSIHSKAESGEVYFVFSDQLGTPRLVENRDGTSSSKISISPYGNCSIEDSEVELNLRFPGHYYDQETGLSYNRFRYYDSGLGRYMQSDPWGLGGGSNLYAYRANPLGSADVRGLGEEHNCQQDVDLDMEDTQVDIIVEIPLTDIFFDSAEDAAVAAMQDANPGSQALGEEVGGWIRESPDGFSVLPPVVGTENSVDPGPPGPSDVAVWHTHPFVANPDGSNKYDSENFSGNMMDPNTDGDIGASRATGRPVYVATPSGAIKKYDPDTETISILPETAPP